jgi:ArsR family transcriptional regulator
MKPGPDTAPLVERLGTLSDVARLRIVRLLEQHELSVGELARALQLPQSTVSRHLKLLHDGDWIIKRHAGTASLYRMDEETLDPDARALWSTVRAQLGSMPTFDEDDGRLRQLLAERRTDSSEFFGRLGAEWDQVRRSLFGAHFTAEALLGLVCRRWVNARGSTPAAGGLPQRRVPAG